MKTAKTKHRPATGAAAGDRRCLARSVYAAEIEHGIPLPWIRGCFNAIWAKMQEGDSLKLPDYRARTAAITSGKRAGHTVTSEKLNGDGYRVWLVSKRSG